MGAHNSATLISRYINGPTILVALAVLLPGIAPAHFGILSGLLAIPVCCLLVLYGTHRGTEYAVNGSIMAILVAIITNILPGILFSLALIPLGISFGRSAAAKKNEINTALSGLFIFGVSIVIYGVIVNIIKDVNPYNQLLDYLDAFIVQVFEVNKNRSDIPLETINYIDQELTAIRSFIPKLLPGTLACILLTTVWINLAATNAILKKLKPGILPWKKYSEWYLPDKLVWLPVFAGFALLFGNDLIATAGLSFTLISIQVYFFQGLSILIFFIDRWNTPLLLKIAIYAILLQMTGLLVPSLAFIGLADVWIDLRDRYNKKIEQSNN